jgi:4-hydroxy-tetrahydrodipicolinate synthase
MSVSDFSIRGVITALVTPFDAQGKLNESSLERLVEFQIRAGVSGLSPCGTTGETALLTVEERQRIAEIVVRVAKGRIPVLVQTGAADTETTIALTRHAQKIGAHAATVVTPYFYRLSDEALIQHYTRVATSVPDFPIYLYNIPQLTGNNLSPSVVHAIADRCPNVVGLKDSCGILAQIIDSAGARSGKFNVAIGSDGLIVPALVSGIHANISGNANACPEVLVELHRAFARSDLEGAQAAQIRVNHIRRILKDGADLSLFKAVLTHRGILCGGVRAPLMNASKEISESSIQALADHGIALTPAGNPFVRMIGSNGRGRI